MKFTIVSVVKGLLGSFDFWAYFLTSCVVATALLCLLEIDCQLDVLPGPKVVFAFLAFSIMLLRVGGLLIMICKGSPK